MKRTSLVTGVIFPALLAIVPACDDPFTCPASFTDCGGICIDVAIDNDNCGACGTTCDTDETCAQNACTPNLVCTAPEENCGGVCINTQTTAEHCGSCNEPCAAAFSDCVAGACAAPLVVMRTVFESKGSLARNLHVLQDVSFTLTQLNTGGFFANRVIDHAVLPDGRVLMVAAETGETAYELWLASPRGGTLTRVNGPIVAGGEVRPGIAVSADGRKVLYRADQDTLGVDELYLVSLDTPGTSAKVNGALIEGGTVSRVFSLSADGRRAAYIASQDSSTLDELYAVNVSAAVPAAPVKLNPVITDSIWDFEMLPDGNRAVYRAYDPGTGRIQLHVVSMSTPGQTDIINYADGAEGTVTNYHLNPDGSGVAFTGARQSWDESLWYVDLAPTGPFDATELAVSTDFSGVREDFVFSPDGNSVFLRKIDDEAFGFDRLYRVDVAAPTVLTQLSAAGTTSAEEVTDFALAPDGTGVVYRGGADGPEGGQPRPRTFSGPFTAGPAPSLYYVDLTAAVPAPEPISPAPMVDHQGIAPSYAITADSDRVVYAADDDEAFTTDAYLVEFRNVPGVRKVSPPFDGSSDATDVSLITRF